MFRGELGVISVFYVTLFKSCGLFRVFWAKAASAGLDRGGAAPGPVIVDRWEGPGTPNDPSSDRSRPLLPMAPALVVSPVVLMIKGTHQASPETPQFPRRANRLYLVIT
jgi:hypothetical protein